MKHCHQVEWDDPSPLVSTDEANSGFLCPVLGPSIQDIHGHIGESPVHKLRASHVRKGWEGWYCPAERRECSGKSHQCVWIPKGRMQGGWSQVFNGPQWQGKKQWAQTEIPEVPSEHQELLLVLWGWLSTGTCCPVRWWNLQPWRYSKATLNTGLGNQLSVAYLKQGSLNRRSPEVLSNLCDSMIWGRSLKNNYQDCRVYPIDA